MAKEEFKVRLDEMKLNDDYAEYKVKGGSPRWQLANEVLYKMCEDNMLHEDADVIASKVFLIGRSYAVAVERQHRGEPKGDSYYYEEVVPELKSLELDKAIAEINSKSNIEDSLEPIFKIHNELSNFGTKAENGEEGDARRPSFASKYLHFHCRDKVFIYDERARKAIARYVISGNYKQFNGYDNRDYQIFVYRARAVLKKLLEKDSNMGPRELDDFLLWVEENKVQK